MAFMISAQPGTTLLQYDDSIFSMNQVERYSVIGWIFQDVEDHLPMPFAPGFPWVDDLTENAFDDISSIVIEMPNGKIIDIRKRRDLCEGKFRYDDEAHWLHLITQAEEEEARSAA